MKTEVWGGWQEAAQALLLLLLLLGVLLLLLLLLLGPLPVVWQVPRALLGGAAWW
jgi:hypothetical protein